MHVHERAVLEARAAVILPIVGEGITAATLQRHRVVGVHVRSPVSTSDAGAALGRSWPGRISMKSLPSKPVGRKRVQFHFCTLDDSPSMTADKGRVKGALVGVNSWLKLLKRMDQKLHENGSEGESQAILVSILTLNRGYLVQDADINDVPDLTESAFLSTGSTPLWETWLQALQDLDGKIRSYRSQGKKARAAMFAFTDGEANPGTPQTVISDTIALMARLMAPKNAGGGDATKTFSVNASPIGPGARSFYEQVGVPAENIFEPDLVSGEGCEAAIIEAMTRASIKSMIESNPGLLPAKDVGGNDLLGDLYLGMKKPSV